MNKVKVLINQFQTRQFYLCSSLNSKNHYDALGITPHATQNDIKSAYYKLSLLYHPDKNKNSDEAAEKFREITSAYEVLGNFRLRKLYDKGILHTAGKNFSGATETVYDTYSEQDEYDDATTKFYKARMKRTHTTAASGRTPIYDFDNWNKMHYGENFDKSQKAKKRFEDKMQKETTNRISLEKEYIVLLLMVGIVFFLSIHKNVDDTKLKNDPPKTSDEN